MRLCGAIAEIVARVANCGLAIPTHFREFQSLNRLPFFPVTQI